MKKQIQWIPREPMGPVLTFSNLMVEIALQNDEPQTHIECLFCERKVLENLMNVKVKE